MTDITFSYDYPFFYSSILQGGIKVQLVFPTKAPVRVVLETRLSSSNPWIIHRNFTASGSLIISIHRYSEGQEFRIRTYHRPDSAQAYPLDTGSAPSEDDFNALSDRVQALEDNDLTQAPEIDSAQHVTRIIGVDMNGKPCSVKPKDSVDNVLSSQLDYDLIARSH